MEKMKKLRKLIDAIKQTPASELSLKVNERICGHYDEAGYRIGITKRTISGRFRGYPICASYLPNQNPIKNYECKIGTERRCYVFPYETYAEMVTEILEEKYYKITSEEKEIKVEDILLGKLRR